VTTRGFKEEEMREVGRLICMAAFDFKDKRREILERVAALCGRFPIYEC
jgi:glycine hydroxymethyltransferase